MTALPFLVRVRHGTNVIAELEIDGLSTPYYLGSVVTSAWPEELRAALAEYTEIMAEQSLRALDGAQDRIVAWGLRVDGIPGRDDARLVDLQLETDGTFALKVE